MKPLYFLEIARSIDIDNQPIPARDLQWRHPKTWKVAYEDFEKCTQDRLDIQGNLNKSVLRVSRAGFLKSLFIRISQISNSGWLVIR